MARIYKRSDRIVVQIDDVTVKLAPLSLDQKTEIQQALLMAKAKGDLKELTKAIVLAVKYSLKDIRGVQDEDGEYKLRMDGDVVADDCLEEIMNLDMHKKLTMVTMSMLAGVPKVFTDEENKAIEGVEILNQPEGSPAGKT